MKYKLTGVLAACLMLFCAVMASTAEAKEGPNRVHQHLTARQPDAGCDCDGSELCTHLPLVIIDTEGQEIPGKATGVTDDYGEMTYTLAPDGRDVIDVKVDIIDNQDRNNHPSDPPAVETRTEIRFRGHSSRNFEKSPYQLDFVDENGENRDIAVMGMSAHSEWVLYGPYLDKSLVRNYMWYNISGEIMEWAPNARFCELILDGEYRGLYLMVETITNGTDCRLNLTDDAYGTRVTGYLLRGDRTTEADAGSVRDIYTFTERSFNLYTDISVRYPKKSMLTEELREQIELDFAGFEKALYSYDYDTGKYGYWNYIDVDNFVDYCLINLFSSNLDAGLYSTYIYKDMEGLYKLAVWDFNNACDNYPDDVSTPYGVDMYADNLFFMLFKSETFVNRLIERYEQLREGVFSEEYLIGYIDDTLDYLGPAVERNTARWDTSITEWSPLEPEDRNVHSVEEAVTQLKDWLIERGNWLDRNIDTLKQYAHPSRNKVYNH